MKDFINSHWQQILAIAVSLSLTFWAISCQPTVPSLTDPSHKVTRAELQTELQGLQATFQMRSTQLAQQEQIRKLILENALIMAETQAFNPLGIVTSLAALYGIGSATRDTTNLVKKKKKQLANTT